MKYGLRNIAFLFAFLFALSASLVGCREIKVDDGTVPEAYLPTALRYMGSYQGKMGDQTGVLVLFLHQNQVIAEFHGVRGDDLIDPRCGSQIGSLKAVKVDETKPGFYKLQVAKFAFNPQNCWPSVDGRELVLNFKEDSSGIRVSASILLQQRFEEQCRIESGNPAAGVPPRQVCSQQPVLEYHKGRFERKL